MTQDPYCTLDESANDLGPNRCSAHSECSGARTCSPWGWCQGTSGCDPKPTPAAPVVDNACNYDEAQNSLGANRCYMDNECAGARTCSDWGWCQGVSGCDVSPAPAAPVNNACNYDEATNPMGPNRCTVSTECAGARTCSMYGWC